MRHAHFMDPGRHGDDLAEHRGHRHGHHRGGPGGPPWAGGPPWGGPPFGRGGFGRGRRRKRGDVRAALLLLLAEEQLNGYGLMQAIEQRSEGAWRPSPGSVYPALQQLEDEGLVRAVEEEQGRKVFALTDAGRAHVDEHREQLGQPWADTAGDPGDERHELHRQVMQLGAAVMQVATAGDDAQVAKAKALLADTRRGIYRILAEDEATEGDA